MFALCWRQSCRQPRTNWAPSLRPAPATAKLNTWIRASCSRTSADPRRLLSSHGDARQGAMRPELTLDGVHPNKAGHRAMAPTHADCCRSRAALKSGRGDRPGLRRRDPGARQSLFDFTPVDELEVLGRLRKSRWRASSSDDQAGGGNQERRRRMASEAVRVTDAIDLAIRAGGRSPTHASQSMWRLAVDRSRSGPLPGPKRRCSPPRPCMA